jgi:hypothetical protein
MSAEDYVGPPGHEKKFHKTHFEAVGKIKHTHPKDDPNWYEYAPGRWRRRNNDSATPNNTTPNHRK